VKAFLWLLAGALFGVGGMYAYTNRAKIVLWFTQKALAGAGPLAATDPGVALRQLRRYAFASSQDKSPIVGLTHASYALVLLDTLEEMGGRDALRATGIDPTKVRAFITALQDRHAEALRQCDPYMQQVLALERAEGNALPGFVMAGAGAAPMGA
jgi:hypothetical protein